MGEFGWPSGCKALDQLRSKTGVLCFIATNNWVTNAGAAVMREQVARRATMLQLIDFVDYKIFGSADIQTMILVLRNDPTGTTYSFDLRRLNKVASDFQDVENLLTGAKADGLEYLNPEFKRDKYQKLSYNFTGDANESILETIRSRGNFVFDSRTEVAQGIVPNPDVLSSQGFSNFTEREISELGIVRGAPVFVVPKNHFNDPNQEERNLLKPLYEPSDVDQYLIRPNRLEIIYSTSAFGINLPPRLLAHLKPFKAVMGQRRETRDGRLPWYCLHWPRDQRFFENGGRILSVRKCAHPTFTYVEGPAYVMMAFNVIKTPRLNQLYLTGLLNSTVVAFWLRHRGKMQGHLFQVDKEPLLGIPIYQPLKVQQDLIAGVVKAVIAIKRFGNEKSAHAARFEQLINGLIYELYFPEPLQSAGINLMELSAQVGLAELGAMEGAALTERVNELAEHIFSSQHPIRGLLFDLQGIPVVRLIEGRE